MKIKLNDRDRLIFEHLKLHGALSILQMVPMLKLERVDIARAVWSLCDRGIVTVGPDWKIRIVEGKWTCV